MPDAAYALVDAPWGPIHVAATADAVVAVQQLTPTDAFVAAVERLVHGAVSPAGGAGVDRRASALAEAAAGQLDDFLSGRRQAFDLPLAMPGRPDWDRAVLGGVGAVPWGSVTSYGRVARRIGRPGAARAVGGAVGRNPIGIVIPCHRVVAGDGSIGGYGGDWFGSRERLLEVKRELLRREGVTLPAAVLVD
jgi:methylated-DNA-[protein]-cysteine S-methyltransferase